MKHNKLIFAILAFIVIACFFIYVGSIITDFSASYPGHEWSLFVALVASYFPACSAILGGIYFIKYLVERKKNTSKVSHVINISRAITSTLVFFAWFFHYFYQDAYFTVKAILGAIILALFAAELATWLVSLKKKNA